jgi:glycosyltransferase involved in cell wall biosynthesis
MIRPLVSVIIATWNTGKYLPETLASALAQTWPNLEVIVVDDGSTDGTRDAIAEFLPRIRYEPRPHLGLAAARNEGIRLAQGAYVALLDADDLWHPEKIAVQVEVAERHPEAGMIVCDGVEFSEEGILRETALSEPLSRAVGSSINGEAVGDFQRDLISGCGIACPAQVLIPRRVLHEIGPFTDSQIQDYDYYLRLSLRYPIALHSHTHVRYRHRSDAMSAAWRDNWLLWLLSDLPVLKAHRRRCRPEDRQFLEARIRGLATSLGHGLMTQGRSGARLEATARLLRVFRWHPWPPTVLIHLAGLWSPQAVFRIGTRLTRSFRRSP